MGSSARSRSNVLTLLFTFASWCDSGWIGFCLLSQNRLSLDSSGPSQLFLSLKSLSLSRFLSLSLTSLSLSLSVARVNTRYLEGVLAVGRAHGGEARKLRVERQAPEGPAPRLRGHGLQKRRRVVGQALREQRSHASARNHPTRTKKRHAQKYMVTRAQRTDRYAYCKMIYRLSVFVFVERLLP